VSYAQTGLKLQSRRKKISLTAKLALVIQMDIVCANRRSICWVEAEADTQFEIFDLFAFKKQCLIFIYHSRFIRFKKPTSYLFYIISVFYVFAIPTLLLFAAILPLIFATTLKRILCLTGSVKFMG